MTTTSTTSASTDACAAGVINSLLQGATPNGTDPQSCGQWATVIAELYQAHANGGTVAVKNAWHALTRQDPNLIGLIAGKAKPTSAVPTSATPVPALPHQAQIPESLGDTACSWLDEFISFSRTWSPRSYDGFHEAVGLWILSTVASRRVMLDLGGPRYTNLYLVLCGRTSVWSKSSAAKIGLDLLRAAGLETLLAPDDATPQAFIRKLAVRVPQDYAELPNSAQTAISKRLTFAGQRGWFYDEFGQKLAAMMRDGGAMADYRGLLRRFDDCPPEYQYDTIARGSELIEQPYLALLGSLTPADLEPFAKRGGALWGDGFFARFGFVVPPVGLQPSQKRFPPGERTIPQSLVQPLQQWHQRLGVPTVQITERLNAQGKGTGTFDVAVSPLLPERCTLGTGVFNGFYDYMDGLTSTLAVNQNTDLDGNYARFPEKALRIAMLLASFENQGRIEMRHWARAQAITERWRANLHSLIEQVNEQEIPTRQRTNEDRVLHVLEKASTLLTAREVAQNVRGLSTPEVAIILEALVLSGDVQKVTGGRTIRYQV